MDINKILVVMFCFALVFLTITMQPDQMRCLIASLSN